VDFAVIGKGETPKIWFGMASKVIVCDTGWAGNWPAANSVRINAAQIRAAGGIPLIVFLHRMAVGIQKGLKLALSCTFKYIAQRGNG